MKPFLHKLMKFILIGLLPLLLLSIAYYHLDPFRVIKTYTDYSYPRISPNRDYISTTMFLKNQGKQQYNSFIFGSSRTLGFKPSSWSKLLPATAKPYMFDASSESIYGIYTKLKFLDSLHVNIDNALIILCRDVSFSEDQNPKGHLFIKHPAISGGNPLVFQAAFYKAYLSPDFLFRFYSYKVLGEFKAYMGGYVENRDITYDTLTNEIHIIDQEKEITKHPLQYYEKRAEVFYARKGETNDSISRIKPTHHVMLKEVKRILEKNKTNYKIVLSPLYEQTKFNPVDKAILKSLFGSNIYDFSGKNQFTDAKTNYYETSHFRPNVGDSIMKIIY